jgi:hypothetical protein
VVRIALIALIAVSMLALTACGSGSSGESEPAPLSLGVGYSFQGPNGDEVTLTALRVVDPAHAAPGQLAFSGNPFVGIVVQVGNNGAVAFDGHSSVAFELFDQAGIPFYPVSPRLTDCPAPGGYASGDVEVPPNGEIMTCEAFSVSSNDPLGQLWVKISGQTKVIWNV